MQITLNDNKEIINPAAINLVLDATYFGREYGFFCFSDGKNIIYSRQIKTEGVKVFKECLAHLQNNLNDTDSKALFWMVKEGLSITSKSFIQIDQFKCANSIRR